MHDEIHSRSQITSQGCWGERHDVRGLSGERMIDMPALAHYYVIPAIFAREYMTSILPHP